ncbi:heme NO-binding domain-containing protein [Gymnodinialimonas hymeniacidonis]|uniref:heme NO-binding domain-containing protein n=1 Tax=Gymnodinialimonas hymeniacidonis TaxID=3126508 RepID=UPI0034C6CDCA
MHGMINGAFQGFLVETYGRDTWDEVRSVAQLRFTDFEAMLRYEDKVTLDCFQAATDVLHKHPNALLEDLGTFLITHEPYAPLKRLLRFGGATLSEFILSLDELADRGRMAMPDIEMPEIEVSPGAEASFRIKAAWSLPGVGPILLGALRAMADDYGALATLSLDGFDGNKECIRIDVFDMAHSEGNAFVLGAVPT